ncbi:hypothetical protein GOP47_0011922 [Adiantum capillus-veneris]|uniref:BHLH domain-containing protein n=1 Tax=Adiantum capillus-veneris TaxID=13818 RepID=A0A9D4USN7_ADICA|nr:hypothetical protein GOP47_0011294 [Adiantum capillus-veneris]KAI5073909.1 hypothetical protein GOP47_0011922 [Adiantum capillus-veneris]
MEPDSFLDLLSPGFNDQNPEWGNPADFDPYSMPTSALAWLTDGFINTEGIEEYEDEEEEDDEDEFEPQLKMPTSPSSALNSSILSKASEYSSVLKLSDIASALHNFSKADGMAGTLPYRRRARQQSPSPVQSASNFKNSPSVPNCSFATRSSLPNVCAVSKYSSQALEVQPCSFNASSMSNVKDVSVSLVNATKSGSKQVTIEKEACIKESSDSGAANEKESSSKVTSDGGNGWDVSDNDDEDEDEGDNDSAYYEDLKPCVSHVRIIRRPNSNCGQALGAPSPKRAKLSHVKAEATSSCDTASLQEDKDGEGGLKQIRKEGMSQREVHILSERQRRKSMRESFSILQSLVPKLKLKHTDRITVLTEVITYIQSLRGTLEELERKKADIMELLGLSAKGKSRLCLADVEGTITYVNSNDSGSSDEKGGDRAGGWCNLQNGERVAMVEVTVRMCGADVFVTLNTPHRRGVWSGVLLLLQKFRIEVSNATLATSGDSSFHCIHAKATNLSCVEGVDLQEKIEGVIVKELRRPSRKGHY